MQPAQAITRRTLHYRRTRQAGRRLRLRSNRPRAGLSPAGTLGAVSVVPSSPRVRRRLVRLGIALTVAVTVGVIAVAVRSPKQPNPAPAKNAPPAQLVTQSTHVAPAERRAINRTLDRFIPAALGGQSAQTAWSLAGPELKGGSTLREWRHGTSPIPYYPPRGKTFHDWTTVDAGSGYVDFNLLIHPKHDRQGSSEVFSGQMLKRGGRWVVNGLYTIAVFARPNKSGRHEVGPADFAAGPAAQSSGQATPPLSSKSASLGKTWLFAVGGAILLALLFPLGFALVSVIRSRRARRSYMGSDQRVLPPLPGSPPRASEPAGSGGIGAQRR